MPMRYGEPLLAARWDGEGGEGADCHSGPWGLLTSLREKRNVEVAVDGHNYPGECVRRGVRGRTPGTGTLRPIATPAAPPCNGHYSQAVVARGLVFLSNPLPLIPGTSGMMLEGLEAQIRGSGAMWDSWAMMIPSRLSRSLLREGQGPFRPPRPAAASTTSALLRSCTATITRRRGGLLCMPSLERYCCISRAAPCESPAVT
jgi:hypothetical protein